FMAAVLVLIYFDLRVRKEGFDLDLLSQGVGIPGATLPDRGPWVTPGTWAAPSGGGWPAPSGGWPAPSGGWPPASGGPPGEPPEQP
ncbi:MAG TPA: hypothetical protein VGQ80_01280, partial [Acidimicrobiia bacterium]|nr:hypothetical protein [Acidimicrobiia bacterium]